jgi:hypothetical protein
MPANWSTFIERVSNKLSGQSIQGAYDQGGKNVDDFATFLADEYVSAISNKAQTPFGNLHQKGNIELLKIAFSKAFKLLEEERLPTLDQKLKDPKYGDLKDPIPSVNTDAYLDKFDLEFLDWAESRGATIPDFTYSLFFPQFPNFPTTRSQQVLEIARRIAQKYDGTSDYIQWLYLIGFDPTYPDWTKDVIDKSVEIIKSIGTSSNKKLEDFKNSRNIKISKELFQEEHINDPERIPDYMKKDFITKFTYDKNYNSKYFKRLTQIFVYDPDINAAIDNAFKVSNILTNNNLDKLFRGNIDSFNIPQLNYLAKGSSTYSVYKKDIENFLSDISREKAVAYDGESRRFAELKKIYIQELADAEKKASEKDDVNDPYIVMATGVLAYWVSTLQQPFSSTPPVPPCIITAPLGGFYIPIYYGSRKRLADYLRRAFNTGKLFKTIPERKISATAVASALAFSFAANMLEFKLIYNGGIPTTNGPVPMIGFVPIVF